MAIRRTQILASPAAGGAGVATATAKSSEIIQGEIIGVHLAYLDSPPAGTTDVSIAEAHNSPAVPVLTVSNAATDGWFYPRAAAVNQAAAAITNSFAPIRVADYLSITIAQANNGDGVRGTVVWDDLRGWA